MFAAISHLILVRLLLASGPIAGAPAGRAPDSLPDLTGRWELVYQETSAPRRRGQVGAVEDPLAISREGAVLRIASTSLGQTGPLIYDLTGRPVRRAGSHREELVTETRIKGRSLVTRKMTVILRIRMAPLDLKRVSRWRRIADQSSSPGRA